MKYIAEKSLRATSALFRAGLGARLRLEGAAETILTRIAILSSGTKQQDKLTTVPHLSPFGHPLVRASSLLPRLRQSPSSKGIQQNALRSICNQPRFSRFGVSLLEDLASNFQGGEHEELSFSNNRKDFATRITRSQSSQSQMIL